MKLNRIVAAALFLAAGIFSSGAMAQCTGQAPARTICGNPSASQGLPRWVPSGASIPAIAQGDILYGSAANVLSTLPAVQAGQPLISGGVATAPLYAGSWARFLTSSQRLTLSRNAVTWAAAGTTSLHIAGPDSPGGEARAEWTANNSDSVAVFGRLNGTFASPTPLAADNQVMGLIGVGIDTAGSTTMQQGGAFGGFASQAWTSTHHGYYFQFFGINDNTVDLVNYGTFKNQKTGFGKETNPQYGITYSLNATTGIASPFTQAGFGAIGADSGGSIGYEAIAFSNTPLVNLYRANGTNAAKTAPTSGQQLGGFFGNTWDGAAWQVGAGMYAVANQNHSAGVAGTRLDFYANANGGASNTLAASIFGGGTLSVFPTSGTTTKGISIAQTAPSSGTPTGPVLFNSIDVTNPGLGASGAGHDNFGGQSLIYGVRATMSITGTSSGSGSAAFGAFTNIAAASDGFGGSHGVTITGASPAGHNAWGHIGYGIVFNGGQIGLLVGVESEMGIFPTGSASFRAGFSANSQGPTQGSVLDAAFVANTINIAGYGGNAAAWQHFMALSGSMYSGIGFPLAATGDLLFSDTSGTIANGINLGNVAVTGSILKFQNLIVPGAAAGFTLPTPAAGTTFQFGGQDSNSTNIEIDSFGGMARLVARRADGTSTAPTAVQSDESIGIITMRAYDGTAYFQAATAIARAAQNLTGSNHGSYWIFSTIPLNSTTEAEAIRIQGSGCLSIGTTTDCGAANILVNGHILASGTVPTVSSCGVSPSISGGDNFGSVTAGTGILSSCVINFGKTWGTAPRCVVSSSTAIASLTVSATTTQLTIGGTSLTGDAINWVCGSTASLESTNDNELVAFEKTG